MTEKLDIRETTPDDLDTIESLYLEAFPDENLLPLVRDLMGDATVTLSLAGVVNSQLVGHLIFTNCGVAGSHASVALLGPLVVAPSWQGQGIGSAIVGAGLQRLETAGMDRVFVLGDPAYYKRLGFLPDTLVKPPYPLPAEWDGAWQSRKVGGVSTPLAGTLSVPRQWRQPALWAP